MFEEKVVLMNQQTEAMPTIGYEKRIYTIDEIQDILGISRSTAYKLVKSNVFHYVKVPCLFQLFYSTFDFLDSIQNPDYP